MHRTEDAIEIGPIGVRADADEVAVFATALGLDAAPGSVPLTFPIRWLALPAVREAIENVTGTVEVVHASQSFRYGARIEIDRDYCFRAAIRVDRDPSPRFIVCGTVCDQGDHNVLQLETVLHPITVLSAAMMPNEYEARSASLPELEIGKIDMAQAERYAAAAHDHNRLHCDADFARSVGLDRPIIHGMMMMSMFQKALSAWQVSAPVSRLFALFARPVPVGSRLVIGGRILSRPKQVRGEQQIVRLFVRTERRQIACIGEALMARDPSSPLPAP